MTALQQSFALTRICSHVHPQFMFRKWEQFMHSHFTFNTYIKDKHSAYVFSEYGTLKASIAHTHYIQHIHWMYTLCYIQCVHCANTLHSLHTFNVYICCNIAMLY